MAAIDRKKLEKKIRKIYPGISDKAVRSLMINMHIETGLNDESLREVAPSTAEKLKAKKYDSAGKKWYYSINKNFDKWKKGPPVKTDADYNSLTNDERLGVMYAANQTESFAGGFGLIQLTPGIKGNGRTLGALNPTQARERFGDIATEMGYDSAEDLLEAVQTDGNVAAEFNFQYKKKYDGWSSKKLNKYEDPTKMRKKLFNPDEGDAVMGPKITVSSTDYDNVLASYQTTPITQEQYEEYYDGAESVKIDGDNIVVDFGNGNVITDLKETVDLNIQEETDILAQGGTVGADETSEVLERERTETGQTNVTPQPSVLGPEETYSLEGEVVESPVTERVESEGMSNEIVDENDVEGSEYIVTQDEAERVYGPTAKLSEANGQQRISYTDKNGVFREVDRNAVKQDTPNYIAPRERVDEEGIDYNLETREDVQSDQDPEERSTEEINETETEQRNTRTETGQTNTLEQPNVLNQDGEEVVSPITEREERRDQREEGEENITTREGAEVSTDGSEQTTGETTEDSTDDSEQEEEQTTELPKAPEGTEEGEVFTVDGKDYTVDENGNVEFIGNAQIEVEGESVSELPSSSLTLDEVQELYGSDARISTNNLGEEQIIVPGVDGAQDEVKLMSDVVSQRDNRIALEEEKQQELNANTIGLRRSDLDGLEEGELNTRLDQTTLSDEDKEKVKSKWTNANKESIFEQIFQKYNKGDGKGAALALKDAAALLKSSGGISSLVAGFMGAKAAKKGLQEVSVPELNGMTSAFKMYSQQQKALSESGLSYAERRTIEQGIDETYEKGIQNLRVGTGGDRAKFLAGTGALDYNRQTSLLKTAALEDEARRQNRDSYGKLLEFEATQNREKDLFTKSREYNQELADKAMFQNTASSAFKHVFDNIRFGQDYKPLMDQMSILATQISGTSGLVNDLNTDQTVDDNIEQTDPNEPTDGNE